MRRDLARPICAAPWPAGTAPAVLTSDLSLQAHHLLSHNPMPGEGPLASYAVWLNAFERDPEFDRSRCFLAMNRERVVGVITCWTSAFIKDLVVHPDYRNRGIGAALLTHLFVHLIQSGEAVADLKVMENNRVARRLYEKSDMSYVARLAVDLN
ncbi:GNAT family N-acetyltransferase [Pseudomonas asturiensis]|uniref:GNAT family N-acetyltransferase n=1 Tax=Pseudomonas asturiensis TaxID=1190415 RepID=A0ABX6HJB7_9PSED|nr:GNAT family N-acetyltransferase [Pseudomonas asturiensis]QHF05725.1 GNAT family N-acetyltransferase [Pseudomonas asturiensis]